MNYDDEDEDEEDFIVERKSGLGEREKRKNKRRIKRRIRRLEVLEDDVVGTWREYFEDLYNVY